MDMKKEIKDLAERRKQALEMGGPDGVRRQQVFLTGYSGFKSLKNWLKRSLSFEYNYQLL